MDRPNKVKFDKMAQSKRKETNHKYLTKKKTVNWGGKDTMVVGEKTRSGVDKRKKPKYKVGGKEMFELILVYQNLEFEGLRQSGVLKGTKYIPNEGTLRFLESRKKEAISGGSLSFPKEWRKRRIVLVFRRM